MSAGFGMLSGTGEVIVSSRAEWEMFIGGVKDGGLGLPG